jgi:hypothetical protein
VTHNIAPQRGGHVEVDLAGALGGRLQHDRNLHPTVGHAFERERKCLCRDLATALPNIEKLLDGIAIVRGSPGSPATHRSLRLEGLSRPVFRGES